MAEFVSSFITGFQSVVASDVPQKLPNCKVLNVFDGIIHYRYDGDSHNIEKIPYFNNTFFVLKTVIGKKTNFAALVDSLCKEKKYFLINKGSVRVRFSAENQFTKVEKALSRKAESFILQNSKLKIDRVNPTTELWFCTRTENFAFAGQLIAKREFTEKNLHKGELRPEIAYLLCAFAAVTATDTVLDPFCGFASIPVQLAKKFRFTALFASDIDTQKIDDVKAKKSLANNQNITISAQNAFELPHIGDKSISVVVTDPPWGYYEDIGDIESFYACMFASFKRVLAQNGRMVILSARKAELESAAARSRVNTVKSLNTLVNGKKASVYWFEFLGE